LAAAALRPLGERNVPVLDGIAALLRDSETGVRMMAAEVLAAMGAQAVPALPALLAACDVPDQHVHVQRSLANALGAIGPEARAGLPALRRYQKIPRVQWNADAAIKRIEGAH
jgi:HEAT repeat protein